jgi:mono/diheme cytochrome c family protein
MTTPASILRRVRPAWIIWIVLATLAACGGDNATDVVPGAGAPAGAVAGPDSFLIFPNPQRLADGSSQINSLAYAQAYYSAIDPGNDKDTLDKWKAANGFGSGTGSEHSAVFGDRRDLGYGRRMTARRNLDGTMAFLVENYLVEAGAGYSYSRLNVDAAVVRELKWRVGINAIEFSPGPGGSGEPFLKFFNFSSQTGARELMVDLDGRGEKAMPGICISCHGGRGDALTASGAMPVVGNGASLRPGDVQAKANPLETDAFDFSALPGFGRTDQEAAIKEINRLVLCTIPIAGSSAGPEDDCRRPVASNFVWQGSNTAELIKTAYGGDGLPNATFADTLLPASWATAGQTQLYQTVIVPYCRTCHIARGTGAQSDLDFTSFEKFRSFAPQIRKHVFDRGNMPLGKLVFDRFWVSTGPTSGPAVLADFLFAQGIDARDGGGNLKRPGRPVADPGPDRVVLPGTTTITGGNSSFADTHAWTFVSGPATPALAGANTAAPSLTATVAGTYVLRLVVSRNGVQSDPASLTIVVDPALGTDPASIRFSHVKAMLQSVGCTTCHVTPAAAIVPPVFYNDYDRNNDGSTNATDDNFFYQDLRSRINFSDVGASPLLRKPAGHHHGGGVQPNFDDSLPPGAAGRANLDLLQNWILAGAPK